MIIMGIDLGKARTGIAVCDRSQTLASPLGIIYEWNREKLLAKVLKLAEENDVQMFVVGLPLNIDGTEGDSADSAYEFAALLHSVSGKHIHMWDERYTTVIAHRYMNDVNVRGRKRKQTVDAAAAAIILQSYLDSKCGVRSLR